MDTNLVAQPIGHVAADAVAIVLFEDEAVPAELAPAAAWLEELRASAEFTGKSGEIAVQDLPQGFAAKRLVAVGGGERAEFDERALRGAAGGAARALKQDAVKRLAWGAGGRRAAAAVERASRGHLD